MRWGIAIRSDPIRSDPIRNAKSQATPALIAEEDRQHDFGPVIGRPGRKMTHPYRLINTSHVDVNLVKIINRKTCCGIVRVETQVLHPGDVAVVEVTLVVGDKFGGVVHETEVITDLPSDSSIVLRTSATAHSAFRVEEISSTGEATLDETSEPRRTEFRVFAAGTSTDPPADLDRVELRSTMKAHWIGSKEKADSDDGLSIESRRLGAWLERGGPPGVRNAELLLRNGDEVLHKHVVTWEVVSPITVSPKLIVMKPGKREYEAILRSGDRKPFRITRIECKEPGVEGKAANTEAADLHVVKINAEFAAHSVKAQGTITVFTNHPAQGKVDLPFLILD